MVTQRSLEPLFRVRILTGQQKIIFIENKCFYRTQKPEDNTLVSYSYIYIDRLKFHMTSLLRLSLINNKIKSCNFEN